MNSLTSKLIREKIIELPDFVIDPSVIYEGVSGSHAYGVATDDSDLDIISIVVPPREYPFPHLAGHINGFEKQKQNFETFQKQNLVYLGEKIDLIGYSLIKFFKLAADNNPNVLEILFIPKELDRTYRTPWDIIYENRHIFLSTHVKHKMFGMAYSQLKKMHNKDQDEERLYKYGYHCVRLADQCKQILRTGDLILNNNTEKLTEIRNGRWTFDQIENYFRDSEREVSELYETTTEVPHSPDETQIKGLLLECLRVSYSGPVGLYRGLKGCV